MNKEHEYNVEELFNAISGEYDKEKQIDGTIADLIDKIQFIETQLQVIKERQEEGSAARQAAQEKQCSRWWGRRRKRRGGRCHYY